jgi:hypothetical protein
VKIKTAIEKNVKKETRLISHKLASVPTLLFGSEIWPQGIKNTRKIQETNVVVL